VAEGLERAYPTLYRKNSFGIGIKPSFYQCPESAKAPLGGAFALMYNRGGANSAQAEKSEWVT